MPSGTASDRDLPRVGPLEHATSNELSAWRRGGLGEKIDPMADDIAAISGVTRDLAYRQIDAQLQAGGSYDTKTIGVIAFDVAGVAAVLAAKDSFGPWWWIVVVGLLAASVVGLVALWSRQFDVGPDPGDFYEDTKRGTEAEANIALVTELVGSLQSNDRALSWKATALLVALVLTVATAALAAVSLHR